VKGKIQSLIEAKTERKNQINKQVDASDNIEELRASMVEVEGLNEEIRTLREMLDGMDEKDVVERTEVVNKEIPGVVKSAVTEIRKMDTDDLEYRKAFQQFVTRGTPIPPELRADAVTATTDIAGAIPTVIQNRIIETMETFGNILPLVTRTAFAAGISIPTSATKPTAEFVNEGAGSFTQQKTTSTSITFTNFKLRCEISMTVESSVLALPIFEQTFVRQVGEAMVKKIEAVILSTADGSASNRGILAETPAAGQALTYDDLDYDVLIEAEAALPQPYENGALWGMTKKTFMAFVGMTDAEGHPIARVNYGIAGKPERVLMGRDVVLCGDYMSSFSSSLAQGTVFAFLFNFKDYLLNTVYDLGIQRRQNWDTEDYETKAVMSVDGKVIDKNSLVTLSKKS